MKVEYWGVGYKVLKSIAFNMKKKKVVKIFFLLPEFSVHCLRHERVPVSVLSLGHLQSTYAGAPSIAGPSTLVGEDGETSSQGGCVPGIPHGQTFEQ